MTLVRYTYPYRSISPAFGGFQRSPWFGLESEIDRLFETTLTDFSGTSATRFPVDLYVAIRRRQTPQPLKRLARRIGPKSGRNG